MSGTLVLNASYEPLAVVPLHRAVVLVLAEKAEVVSAGDGQLRSVQVAVPAPAVIRLTRYVRVPYRARVPVTKRGVLVRDRYTCAYCGGTARTIDHVVPRSRGGAHAWTNLAAACSACNGRKGDRLLGELGWTCRHALTEPAGAVTALVFAVGRIEPAWEPYLGAPRNLVPDPAAAA